jgi:long-chain acyl-CoA synthetase
MLTGSAPISAEIIDFIKIVACCPVIEGYGQTESTGGSFLTDPSDPFSGHVGGPLPNNEFKVIDVPEMNYFSTDKDE